ncbi:hypothetical protein ACROYT_G014621 [Oculina patagonica]
MNCSLFSSSAPTYLTEELVSTVAHNCHGKRKRLAAKEITSRQKKKPCELSSTGNAGQSPPSCTVSVPSSSAASSISSAAVPSSSAGVSGKAIESFSAYHKLTGHQWYDEIEYYNYKNPVFSMNTGHFTQVVWKSTTKLGCGVATKSGKTYVVARYYPPGNYNNQYRQNVMREK